MIFNLEKRIEKKIKKARIKKYRNIRKHRKARDIALDLIRKKKRAYTTKSLFLMIPLRTAETHSSVELVRCYYDLIEQDINYSIIPHANPKNKFKEEVF